jgi:hypothetical protein
MLNMMGGSQDFQTKFSGKKDVYPGGATRDAKAGKGRYDLISPYMIRRLAGLYERGGQLYGDRNWESGQPFSGLYSSALRHTWQALAGEKDEDHLAAAIWNLTALIHFEETGRVELNDLPWGKKHE